MNSVDFRSYYSFSWRWSWNVCGIAPLGSAGWSRPCRREGGRAIGVGKSIPLPLARCGQAGTRSQSSYSRSPLPVFDVTGFWKQLVDQ
jgi:hypothetical protein